MEQNSLLVVDLIQSVLDKVEIELGITINYQYGLTAHILDDLKSKDQSSLYKNDKYLLFAVYQPFQELRGNGYYCDLTIRKIVLSTLTSKDDTTKKRYSSEGTFKTVLYPAYESFLNFFVKAPESLIREKEKIVHIKRDFPGYQPVSGTSDFVDSIEIENFQTKLKRV